MKKLILLLFGLTFHLAKSQSTLITPNSGGNGNFLFKSTGANYGQFSTTATGASLVFRVNEPAANNGSTGLITGAIYSDATRTVLAGFTDSGQLYGINKVEIGTNAVSNRMMIDANGNVGIGGVTPTYKLDILGSVRIQSTDFVMGPAAGRGNGGRALVLDSNNMLSINFANDFSGGTFINSNVGIGTLPSNSYKLAINGTARTKEVIVETGWADYVFDDEYQLSSLTEVEMFIKENKHLPDLPSAKDIQEKGAFVGELMTKMMQKIEELTLYSIEQDKKIEKLQKDLVELKNKK